MDVSLGGPRHTWWDQAPAFTLYLARCLHLLRQGFFVADIAYYTGDGIGQFLPFKAAYPALEGRYDYDRSNSEILFMRMSVKDGRIVLPHGMSYRLLVLKDKEPMPVAVLRKLKSLAEAGATILGARPTAPYGLLDDPAEYAALADQLWGRAEPQAAGVRPVGRGRIVWGKPVLQWLAEDGVAPDFECAGVSKKGKIDWIHRRLDDGGELYFVASQWQPVEQVECTFRVSGKIPELWDPVSGQIREAGAFRQEHGRTIVPLRFEPCGSVFVVFRKPTSELARTGKNWMDYQPVQTLDGAWTVGFDPKWFYPTPTGVSGESVVFEQLTDWTKRPEEAIKYYSGPAVYRKTFELSASMPKPKTKLFLDLGDVRELATVRLNGKDMGIAWTKPYRVEITGAVRTGRNELEIVAVNEWPNRLIGDTFLPKEQRRTRTNIALYTQATPLYPSGLLGPVRVLREE